MEIFLGINRYFFGRISKVLESLFIFWQMGLSTEDCFEGKK